MRAAHPMECRWSVSTVDLLEDLGHVVMQANSGERVTGYSDLPANKLANLPRLPKLHQQEQLRPEIEKLFDIACGRKPKMDAQRVPTHIMIRALAQSPYLADVILGRRVSSRPTR
jgi:hypothetical protein